MLRAGPKWQDISLRRKLRLAFGVVLLLFVAPMPLAYLMAADARETTVRAQAAVNELDHVILIGQSIGALRSAAITYAADPSPATRNRLDDAAAALESRSSAIELTGAEDRKHVAQIDAETAKAVLALERDVEAGEPDALARFNDSISFKVDSQSVALSDRIARRVERRHDGLMADVRSNMLLVGNVLLLALGIASALAWSLPRRLVHRLNALRMATRRLARGELDARAQVQGRDEIGELASDFNTLAAGLSKREQQNAELLERERERATRDSLTGLRNHRFFHDTLEVEFGRARRYGRPLAVAVLDIDNFKAINDTFGHAEGDRVLAAVAAAITAAVRGQDVACRIGGEEFAVIFPETTIEDAASALGRIARDIRGLGPGDGALTFSAGVADGRDPHAAASADLYDLADRAAYCAKRAGKNRIELAGEAEAAA